ncbi:hypothetical protein EVAR_57163_1 [Eumeta japonica]|uniref:Craniofacial development protein 2 n=1 Tax=Eumeta variegata TaxID=151549 RepID=A0A4C1YW73_EUMVA|nr:hypothetical protein EVAR_57163_1 [Eumeta japonica]
MKIELQNQNTELKESITNSIMAKMDEKLIPIVEENKNLKTKIEKLEKEIEYYKKVERNNNIIIFGLEEKEKSSKVIRKQLTSPSRLVLEGERDQNPPTLKDNNHQKSTIYVTSLNVLTLRSEDNLTELTYALKQIKWDIIGLSEVRRMGERITSHPDYILYHIGETQGHHEVGFIIKQHIAKNGEEFIGISGRIAVMNIKLPGYKSPWSIAQVYSPTEQSNLETINAFYHDLNETIPDYTHKNLIVMGDFNGQIGLRRPLDLQ